MTGQRGAADGANSDGASGLSDLTEDITRRLQSGEGFDAAAYTALHPHWAGPILDLLPTLYELVELGESLTRERGSGRASSSSTPMRKDERHA